MSFFATEEERDLTIPNTIYRPLPSLPRFRGAQHHYPSPPYPPQGPSSFPYYPSYSASLSPGDTYAAQVPFDLLRSEPPSLPAESTRTRTRSRLEPSKGDRGEKKGSKKEKPKRNRKTVSCNNCRARKIKCDRSLQCNQCLLRKEVCEWAPSSFPEMPRPSKVLPSSPSPSPVASEISSLRSQIRSLTQQLQDQHGVPPEELATLLAESDGRDEEGTPEIDGDEGDESSFASERGEATRALEFERGWSESSEGMARLWNGIEMEQGAEEVAGRGGWGEGGESGDLERGAGYVR